LLALFADAVADDGDLEVTAEEDAVEYGDGDDDDNARDECDNDAAEETLKDS
jgi:hypothetical protein